MSTEIPKAQRWTGDCRFWAVVSGGHIDATFLTLSHSSPYNVSEVPKPSKLTLAIEAIE